MNRVFILDKICLNVDNETDAQNLINQGAKEIKDLSIFKGYESLVSPTNTVVNDDGSITFTAPKEKSLSELKSEKLNELNTIASRYDSYKCDDMYITSSVGGYRFNADSRSQTNLRGLISVLDDVKSVAYKDYDNEFQSLNKEQMQIIFSECILNGQNLYKQKWDYAEKIKTCETIEELNSIEFNFTMMNFS